MTILFANNARTTITDNPLSAGATTINLTSGAAFPSPTGGDYFYATLTDASESVYEIVRVTARSTNAVTVTRGVDGTTAQSWASNSKFELRVTKSVLTELATTMTRNQFSGTGSQTNFTLSIAAYSQDSTDVYVSGVRQVPGTDYTVTGTTLAFTTAPPSGTNNIQVYIQTPVAKVNLDGGLLADGTITTAKIADSNVTTAKLASTAISGMTAVTPTTSDYVAISDVSNAGAIAKALISDVLALISGVPTGVSMDYVGSSAPTGWVMLSGRTIGDGSSGATERANADTQTLYELLWNSMSNTEAPVSSGRGASATADFNAHKTITLPDARGRVIAGKDNMGGTTASRITSGGSGITGTTLGASGGTETHTLTTAQLASHTHALGFNYYSSGGISNGVVDTGSAGGTPSSSTGSAGSGNAHQNTQPTLVLNKIIKL